MDHCLHADDPSGPCEPPSASATLSATCAALGLVGRSPGFVTALTLAHRFAASFAPVLIHGETGTGKELFARAIHSLGTRKGGPFVPVNCGALPETLIESELFGHAKGAFTDAKGDRQGLVAQANRGTLFLDEVDSLSIRGQVALLRFLQDREFRRVGGTQTEHVDVRVIAATNADLVEDRFRPDLRFRLDVLSLEVPALAVRRDDIPLIARAVLTRLAAAYGRSPPRLEAEAEAWLAAQPWPGNVRELENALHRAIVLARNGLITAGDLGAPICTSERPTAQTHQMLEGGLKAARARHSWEFDDQYLRRILALAQGNVSEAARHAGTERRAMGRLLKRHGIEKDAFRR